MMVLADTSVWIDHLRARNTRLDGLLAEQRVLCHPFIVGEIACGRLDQRAAIIDSLQGLQQAVVAEDHEVLDFIERRRMFGRTLGWVDMHLLASVVLTHCELWTRDRALQSAARDIDVPAGDH
jgi:predicted nucleic acid-binding protein